MFLFLHRYTKMSLSNHDELSSDIDSAEMNFSVPDTASASDAVTPTRLLK